MKAESGEKPIKAGGLAAAPFALHFLASAAAVQNVSSQAGIRETVLRGDGYRPSQRVQSVERIRSWDERHFRDCVLGDQIPTHHVAEGLILSDPIHIHRNTSRRSKQRRSRIAAEVHVRLKRIPLQFVDVDAVEPPVHEVAKIESPAVLDVRRCRGLNRSRDLVNLQFRSSERRHRDHIHLGSLKTPAPS